MLWLILGVTAIACNIAILTINFANRSRLRSRKRLRIVTWLVGLVAAVPVVMLKHSVAQDAVLIGFPIPYAVFQQIDGAWMDFVGPLTTPIWLADIVLCAHLLQGIVAVSVLLERRKEVAVA